MINQDINTMVLQMEWMRDTGSTDWDEMRQALASMAKAMANLQLKMGQITHADRRDLLKRIEALCPKRELSKEERRYLERDFQRNGPISKQMRWRS